MIISDSNENFKNKIRTSETIFFINPFRLLQENFGNKIDIVIVSKYRNGLQIYFWPSTPFETLKTGFLF